MDFGDIIYFLILVIFMILGFFNDSRKKKRQKQAEAEAESRPEYDNTLDEMPPLPKVAMHEKMPPPVATPFLRGEIHKEFRSSLDLVSIHGDQSPHSSYNFDYDANSFYEKDPDSPETTESAREELKIRSVHPLIKGLRDETGREELKKAMIYSEIIKRRY